MQLECGEVQHHGLLTDKYNIVNHKSSMICLRVNFYDHVTKNVTVDFERSNSLRATASFASTFTIMVKSFTEILVLYTERRFSQSFDSTTVTIVDQDRSKRATKAFFSFFFNVWTE